MNKTLTRRLDRLQERLLPPSDVPTKCWQIVYVSQEGEELGPILEWRPGPTRRREEPEPRAR
jgi:hypothetical protein